MKGCIYKSLYQSKSPNSERGRKKKLSGGHESQFGAKGARGSLKMDPHPLLMLSLPCLFRLPHEQHAERGEETATKVLPFQSPVCIIIRSQWGGRGVLRVSGRHPPSMTSEASSAPF